MVNGKSFFSLLAFIFIALLPQAEGQFKEIRGNANPNPGPKPVYTLSPKPDHVKSNTPTTHQLTFTPETLPYFGGPTPLKAGSLNEDGLPAYIEGKLKNTVKNLPLEDQALAYVEEAKTLMKLRDENISFLPIQSHKDELGLNHIKMAQYYKGFPVFGAEIIVHGDDEGFDFLNGYYVADITWEKTPVTFSENQAIEKVAGEFLYWQKMEENHKKLLPGERTKSQLVLYRNENNQFVLTHHLTIYSDITNRWEVFVDATTGQILDKYPSLCKFHGFGLQKSGMCTHQHSVTEDNNTVLLDGKAQAVARDLLNVNRSINTYEAGNKFYLIDASRDMFSAQSSFPDDPQGVIWTIDAFNTSPAKDNFTFDHVTSSNNTWVNSPAGVSSHYNGGKAFEYFRIVHNRNSIDGNKGNIVSLINVADEDGSSMGNAFWNGAAMFYGNGDNAFLPLARGLDVAGHEMSHGVIQNTANLVYQGESGALNESFADIFGAMIDRDDWNIGEDVVRTSAFPSGALRSLSNPHNGAQTNQFSKGWQPKHYNERYTGSEDNGGVHINSGIPNHAFFLFATAVGKEVAERVFYRALAQYLTKSSKFKDCRVAVIKAATDFFGANSNEVSAAKKAFTDVGILGDNQDDYQNDAPQNPGQDLILFTNQNKNGLFITNANGQPLAFANPLTSRSILSKPSISDDGSEIVYVGADKKIYYININWNTNQKTETVLGSDPVWRNVIISKDGLKVAALEDDLNNLLYVFDFSGSSVVSNTYELYNPTFTSGVTTGDVLYADAMEFDLTGEYIIYDAENELRNTSGGTISYWDIGFIKVWNNANNSFALGDIDKLFSALPNDVSAGNPTFSKNSPYIIAFDYIEGSDNYLLGANLETGTVETIFENNVLAYPTYATKDNQMMFDNFDANKYRIARIDLQDNKIESKPNTGVVWLEGFRWATWFSNGKRVLSSNEDITETNKSLFVFPNPVSAEMNITYESIASQAADIVIHDIKGVKIWEQKFQAETGKNTFSLPVHGWMNGVYFVSVMLENKIYDVKMIQIQK